MEKKRFKIIYSQGALTATSILVDTETGIEYLFHRDGNSGGLTPLLRRDGTPAVHREEEE